jgi:hypothetical protein
MTRIRISLGCMVLSLLIMIVDMLWHSPLTMTIFLSAGLGSAGVAIVSFALYIVDTFRVRVTVRPDASDAPVP